MHRLTQVETSRPGSRQGRIRGGSFWGEVLDGRFPANFFQANPFVASARGLVNDNSSTYHAVEFELRRRFASGFSLQTNYTFGRAISDFDGDESTLLNAVRPSSVRFPRSVRGEFAPRHLFKANWIYELPFGAGKSFLNQNNLVGKILGGWQFGGIVNWRGGRPRSFVSGVGTFHRNAISDINTVNLSQDTDGEAIRGLTGRRDISGGVFWIDPCTSAFLGRRSCSSGGGEGLFTLPEPGELGPPGLPSPCAGREISESRSTTIQRAWLRGGFPPIQFRCGSGVNPTLPTVARVQRRDGGTMTRSGTRIE